MSYFSCRACAAAVTLMLLAAAGSVAAQAARTEQTSSPDSSNHWEMLFSTGKLVPTGVERQTLKNAPLSTGQLSYVIAAHVAVTTTFGWARSRDLVTEGNPRLSVFLYDVGIEARAPRWRRGESFGLTPFAGVGGGGRSFDYRGRDLDATHAPTGYAAVGGEVAVRVVRVRLEARDYVTGMGPLVGEGGRGMRNDVGFIVGMRLVRKRN